MTICTKQSIQLHRESVDNLHAVIDANVKVEIIIIVLVTGNKQTLVHFNYHKYAL